MVSFAGQQWRIGHPQIERENTQHGPADLAAERRAGCQHVHDAGSHDRNDRKFGDIKTKDVPRNVAGRTVDGTEAQVQFARRFPTVDQTQTDKRQHADYHENQGASDQKLGSRPLLGIRAPCIAGQCTRQATWGARPLVRVLQAPWASTATNRTPSTGTVTGRRSGPLTGTGTGVE